MTTGKIPTLVAVLLLASISATSGSVIDFRGSHSSIKPIFTSNFTLRCALNDTSPSPGSPSSIVGKRSVGALNHVMSEEEVLKVHRESKGTTRSVTSTPDNVMLVTAIIISKDGQDIATMIDHFSAKLVNGASGYHVTGQLTPGAEVKGYLQLVLPHPSLQDAGNYRCDVDTLGQTGRHVDFSQTLTVAEAEVSMADLVGQLSAQQKLIDDLTLEKDQLKQENTAMKTSIDGLTKKYNNQTLSIDVLKQTSVEIKQGSDDTNRTLDYLVVQNNNMSHTIDHMTLTITDLKQKNTAMNNAIAQLKSEKFPRIFFTAAYSSRSSQISSYHTVVYSTIIVNEGGDYSRSNGIFTCRVAGFYYFEFTAVAANGHDVSLELQKNRGTVVRSHTATNPDTYDSQVATNSAIVHLSKGDTMKVISLDDTYLWGADSTNNANTFTGQIIAQD